MNRKIRKSRLQKLAQQHQMDNVIQKELDAMNASDSNNAGGETPEQFADRVTLELIDAMGPIPGLEED